MLHLSSLCIDKTIPTNILSRCHNESHNWVKKHKIQMSDKTTTIIEMNDMKMLKYGLTLMVNLQRLKSLQMMWYRGSRLQIWFMVQTLAHWIVCLVMVIRVAWKSFKNLTVVCAWKRFVFFKRTFQCKIWRCEILKKISEKKLAWEKTRKKTRSAKKLLAVRFRGP